MIKCKYTIHLGKPVNGPYTGSREAHLQGGGDNRDIQVERVSGHHRA